LKTRSGKETKIHSESVDALRFVIIPQALRVALPSLLGFSVTLHQATSLCFTIALPELVSRASAIGSETFEYLSVLLLAGLLLAVVWVPATRSVCAGKKIRSTRYAIAR
jgi:polar amino acid transport system permease protein